MIRYRYTCSEILNMRVLASWYSAGQSSCIYMCPVGQKTSLCEEQRALQSGLGLLFVKLWASLWENIPSEMSHKPGLKYLHIQAVWSESLLSSWRNFAWLVIQTVPSSDSDQTTNAQTDLNLHWANVRRYIFSHCSSSRPRCSKLC